MQTSSRFVSPVRELSLLQSALSTSVENPSPDQTQIGMGNGRHIIQKYRQLYGNTDKATVAEEVLTQMEIETSIFFASKAKTGTPLAQEDNQQRLRKCLDLCNFVLNNVKCPRQVNLDNLKTQIINVLRVIFNELKEDKLDKLAWNILYIMSHRNVRHNNHYPRHAKELWLILSNNDLAPLAYDPVERYPQEDISLSQNMYDGLPKIEFTRPEYAYTLFVDRCLYEEGVENYGPKMFENVHNSKEAEDLFQGKYIGPALSAFRYLAGINIAEISLENLKKAVTLMYQPPSGEDIFVIKPNRALNPYDPVKAYYSELDSVDELWVMMKLGGERKYDNILFNQNCMFQVGAERKHKGRYFFVSSYKSEEEINEYFVGDKKRFSENINKCADEPQKIAAILLFISQIECSHFFANANTRLCSQILLNVLLVQYNMDPSILYIPNGMAFYVLDLIRESSSNQAKRKNPDIPEEIQELAKCLDPAIQWVREGQEFARQICERRKSA